MAQCTGDSSYDYLWDRQHDVALRVLRRGADLWASGGAETISSDRVIAVLLRIYLSEWPEFGGVVPETRSLESWIERVTTAQQELLSLRPGSDLSALSHLDAELSFAIKQWALGDSESPQTTHVINVVEHILFSSRLTRRPPGPKMPTSLLHHHESPSSGG
jgi:hypothetical protein